MRTYTVEQFHAAMPADEAEPIMFLHRAIYRWLRARNRATELRSLAAGHPGPRLARCAAQQAEEVEAFGGLVAGAAAAWVGSEAGTLFIRIYTDWDDWIRVDWGEASRSALVAAGRDDGPGPADEVLDVFAAELAIMERSLEAVVGDAKLKEECREVIRRDEECSSRCDFIGVGQHTLAGLLCTNAWIAERQLANRGERPDHVEEVQV